MSSFAPRAVLAIGSTAVAIGASLLLERVSDTGIFMIFLASVCLTAALAGLRTGLATTALSIVAVDFFFLLPRGSLRIVAERDLVMLLIYSSTAALIASVAGHLNAQRTAAREEAGRAATIAAFLQRQLEQSEEDALSRATLSAARSAGSNPPSRN